MKLRGRRKEDEDCHRVFYHCPSQASAIAPLRSRSPPPFIFPSFPSSSFAQPATCRSILSAATCRQAVAPAIPPPAVPLLPFFFIKLPKQQSGRPLRSVVPSLPVQLADCGPPSSPHPCPFTKSGGRDSSPVLMASSLWRVEP